MLSLSFESMREKFEDGTYSVYDLPNALFMDHTGVYVDSAPYPDIPEGQERVENRVSKKKKMPTLKATSDGDCDDWDFKVKVIHTDSIDRDSLEEMVMSKSDRKVDQVDDQCIPKISVDEALKKMKVTLSIDMKYYLQKTHDLDADLEYKVSDSLKSKDANEMRKLEQELFYKTMCRLFGKENADDQIEMDGKNYGKSFIIRDFSILTYDGNTMIATARRGDYYLLFRFNWS